MTYQHPIDETVRDFDPRLGSVLDDYQPDPALRARVADVARRYVARDTNTASTLLDLVADVCEADGGDSPAWVPVVVALLEMLAVHTVGPQGETRAVARLASDLAACRDDVLREQVAQ